MLTAMNNTLTPAQIAELARLKSYFPFRIIFGAVSPDGATFDAYAMKDRRVMNKLIRTGWTVYGITR